jgi:hypothetical protein
LQEYITKANPLSKGGTEIGSTSSIVFGLQRSGLPEHLHKIKVVPSLNYFSITDSDNADPSELYLSVTWRDADSISGMSASNTASRSYFVALHYCVLDRHSKVWKCAAEALIKWLEAIRPA